MAADSYDVAGKLMTDGRQATDNEKAEQRKTRLRLPQTPRVDQTAFITAFENKTRPWLRNFGAYCATNQVKVLLTHCLVLCSIIFAVWPFDILPGLSGRSASASGNAFWSSEDTSITSTSSPICWNRIPIDRELHLVQIKATLGSKDPLRDSEHGVLERAFLHNTLRLQQSISGRAGQLPKYAGTDDGSADAAWQCLETHVDSGRCLVSSPLNIWNSSEAALLSDKRILDTLDSAATHSQISQTGASFLSRNWQRKADELVLTWPMRLAKGSGRQGTPQLVSLLESATSEFGTLHPPKERASRHVLRYQPLVTDTPGTQSYDSYYVAAYVVLAAYVGFVMKRLDRVHSRMGMLLVAIVSMASSGMLSLSVCKLLGFSVDNVPWKLLPLLMIVLAVDNTWLLTHAVVSTSVDLPIPERVGAGVAKVGPQILLALTVEHILLFLAFILIPVRAVREMTLLGAIALKADAAMQMTFFLPILSIDIQRLELADLLRQGRLTMPSSTRSIENEKSPLSLTQNAWNGARERLARSIAFVLITTSNLGHYAWYGADYFSVPSFCSDLVGRDAPFPTPSSMHIDPLWEALNPHHVPAVHMHVHAPIYFTFGAGSLVRRPSLFRTLTVSFFSVLLYRVLPVAAITAVEYAIILFMSRNGELLQAEKKRVADEKAAKKAEEARARALPVAKAQVLPLRTFTDVYKVAVSAEGSVFSWSITEQMVHRQRIGKPSAEPDLNEANLPVIGEKEQGKRARLAVSALAVSHDSSYCVTADSAGEVYVWSVASSNQQIKFEGSWPSDSIPVAHLHFMPATSSQRYSFLVVRSDGSVETWDILNKSRRTVIAAPIRIKIEADMKTSNKAASLHIQTTLLPNSGDRGSAPVIARLADGLVELFYSENLRDWQKSVSLDALEAGGPITAMAYARVGMDGEARTLFATGNKHGGLMLWDASTTKLISSFRASSGITQIRMFQGPPACCPCAQAGQCAALALVFSTTNTTCCVRKLFLPPDARICNCTPAPNTHSHTIGRSRSASSFKKQSNSPDLASNELLLPTATHTTPLRRRREVSSDESVVDDSASSRLSSESYGRMGRPRSSDTSITPDSSIYEDPHWHSSMRMEDLGDVALGSSAAVWECCNGLMIAGLRPAQSVSTARQARRSAQGWEAFSVDLSIEGLVDGNIRLRASSIDVSEPIAPLSPPSPPKSEDSVFRRRRDPLASQKYDATSSAADSQLCSQLPFSRVASLSVSANQDMLAASFGNSVAIIRCPSAKPIPSTQCRPPSPSSKPPPPRQAIVNI